MRIEYENEYLIESGYYIPDNKQYKKLENHKIYIYNGEGLTPHFHLLDNTGNLICCICLHTLAYFDHGKGYEKNKELNSKERKSLNNFLNSIDPDNKDATIWTTLCSDWNKNNNTNFIFPTYQPNYSDLDIRITTKTVNINPIIFKDTNTNKDILVYKTSAR